jgi:5-methylcytosine-specific restriction endonuclease McrA
MRAYALTQVSDAVLMRDLVALVAQDRTTTASLLASLAEVDARQLYRPAGYPSMYAYCVNELRLSEDAAYKRIQVARTAREFPILFPALGDGRIHMAAVRLLAPYLKPDNVDELVAAVTHQTKAKIEQMLARRFPRPELLRLDEGISALRPTMAELAPGQVEADRPELAPAQVKTDPPRPELAPGQVPSARARVAPVAAQRFTLQVTIDQSTHDKLRYAQSLLGAAVPSGDVALVLDRALDALINQLEKRKLAATKKPRRPRPSSNKRCVPAHVRRAVWERDRGQCTFEGENGRRCPARMFLEFDHVDPVARGGRATVDGIRLRCRAHNQFEAERAFGAEFMRKKREQAAVERRSHPQSEATRTRSTRTVSVSVASP